MMLFANNLYVAFFSLIISLIFLIWSSDSFLTGAVGIAQHLKLPELLIGILLMSFGTALPELMTAIMAGLRADTGLILGNSIGGVIANFSLVIGLPAIVMPLSVRLQALHRYLVLLILISVLLILCLMKGYLNFYNGLILFLLGLGFLSYIIWNAVKKKQIQNIMTYEKPTFSIKKQTRSKVILLFLFGTIVLPLSAIIVVNQATWVAHYFHVDNILIGLTILALGGALPELMVVFHGARKGHYDLIFGNLIGSSIINLTIVLGMGGMIHAIVFNFTEVLRDVLVMMAAILMFYLFAFTSRKNGGISRLEGTLLFGIYVAYIIFLFFVEPHARAWHL